VFLTKEVKCFAGLWWGLGLWYRNSYIHNEADDTSTARQLSGAVHLDECRHYWFSFHRLRFLFCFCWVLTCMTAAPVSVDSSHTHTQRELRQNEPRQSVLFAL